jgi:hypothetical protein
MNSDLTQGDPTIRLPGDPPPLRVPAWRLDEVEKLRGELEVLRWEIQTRPSAPAGPSVHVPLQRRETHLGPLHTYRAETPPLRTHATPERATAVADVILALRSLGALALAGLAFLAFVVGAAVLTGFVFLALRFVSWARHGDPTGGAIVLGLCGSVIVATGVAVFLRITDPRRTR